MSRSLPTKTGINTVFGNNKNKVFYAGELYKEILKIMPVSYTALCTALSSYPTITVLGTGKHMYGHPLALKKLKKGITNVSDLPSGINATPVLLISTIFDKYSKRVFTPLELYSEFIRGKHNVAQGTLKASLLVNFKHISLAKNASYYGHEKALSLLEKYLKRRKLEYNIIQPKG
jgi:hypothetical protein